MPSEPIGKFDRLKAEAQALLADESAGVDESPTQPRWRSLAQFWVRVGRSFVRNRCPVRAAALAYTTVLALVPLLAVIISISAGLLKKESDKIDTWIKAGLEKAAPMLAMTAQPGETKALDETIAKIKTAISNFQSGGLGVTAVLALIFVGISLLSSIEATLNDMWGVTRGRAWSTRVVQYWTVISLGPLLLLAVTGLATASHLSAFQQYLGKLPAQLSFLITFGTDFLLPFAIVSLALAALYLLLPNTKVYWKAALIGGAVAGLLIQLNSKFNVFYAARVAREKSLYGGLAAIPLFLLGLYFTWIIVLLGAQVAYAFQNRRAYLQEKQAETVSQRGREFVALRLMTYVGQCFQTGQNAPTALEMAERFGVPLRLVGQILCTLLASRLVTEIAGSAQAYGPGRPLDQITVHDILQSLRAGQGQELSTCPDAARAVVQQEFESVARAEEQAARTTTLRSLVDRSLASNRG